MSMEIDPKELISNWSCRNIAGFYFPGRQEGCEKILSMIPREASVGFSGSETLRQLDLISRIEERGTTVFNQMRPGISREESMRLRQAGAGADYFLTSANGCSAAGELFFFSAYGHRTAGIANARNVIVVMGTNKICATRGEAIERGREYVTPRNCKRLDWKSACLESGVCKSALCHGPEFRRMCCQILTIEAEAVPGRMSVIIIGEELGY